MDEKKKTICTCGWFPPKEVGSNWAVEPDNNCPIHGHHINARSVPPRVMDDFHNEIIQACDFYTFVIGKIHTQLYHCFVYPRSESFLNSVPGVGSGLTPKEAMMKAIENIKNIEKINAERLGFPN